MITKALIGTNFQWLRLVPILLLLVVTVLFNTFLSFDYSYPNSIYFYKLLVLFALLCVFAEYIYARPQVLIRSIDLLLLIYAVIISLSLIRKTLFDWNETVENFSSIGISYIAFRRLINQVALIRILISFLTILFFFELLVFVIQFVGLTEFNNSSRLHLNGTIENSGLFAGLITILSPFTLYLCLKQKERWVKFCLVLLIIAVVFFVVYQTRSRASFYAFILILLCLIPKQVRVAWENRSIWTRSIFILIMCSFFSVSSYFIFQAKAQSAIGRELIWKITVRHILDRPILGIGYGNFSNQYNFWQGEYFKNHLNVNSQEKAVADLSLITFNEPLQILLETGLAGLIIFVALVTVIIKNFRHSESEFKPFALCLLSMIGFSLFSYPFHCVPLLIVATISFAVLVLSNSRYIQLFHVYRPVKSLIAITSFIAVSALSLRYIKQAQALVRWNQLQESPENDINEAENSYRAILTNLWYIPSLRLDFSKFLFDHGKFNETIHQLEISKTMMPSIQTILLLGKAHEKLGNYETAKLNYILASNIIPYNLESRYLLVKLYERYGLTQEASKLAHATLLIPVKIPTPAAEEIRDELHELVLKTSNH